MDATPASQYVARLLDVVGSLAKANPILDKSAAETLWECACMEAQTPSVGSSWGYVDVSRICPIDSSPASAC
jgi:hypothetical protein